MAKTPLKKVFAESEKKYHSIFENTGMATLIVNEDNTISMANSKCFQMTGYKPEELVGKKWTVFVVPEYLEIMIKNHNLRRVSPEKAPAIYEVKLINSNREIRDVLLNIGMLSDTSQSIVSISDITELNIANEKLKLSENKFRTVVENSTNLFYTHNVDNVLTYVSPQTEKYFDCSPEEAMTNWQIFLTDNPANEIGIQRTKIAIETGIAQPPYELELKTKKGSIVWVEVNEAPVTLNGKTVAITGSLNDITLRKEAEIQLKRSETEYKDLFYFAPVGIYQTSREGKILIANQKFAEMLGYENVEEVINLNIEADIYWDPAEREKIISKYSKLGLLHNLELRWKKKDGSLIWILLSSHFKKDKGNNVVSLEGFIRDITVLKLSEEKLNVQRTALESAVNGIVITDVNGKIDWVNNAFIELTGYNLIELIGKKTNILNSGKQDETFYNNLWSTIISGRSWHGELINRRKNGSLYTEEMTITPVKDNSGNITNFIAIKMDVSDRILFQNELVQAKEKAEQSNKLKDAFIANISHEIRTPLNGILGMTGLLKGSLQKYIKDDENNYFTAIEQSSSRIVRTIDMILNYSRLHIGEFSPVQKQFDLVLLIDNIKKEYLSLAAAKGLELSFSNKIKDIIIEADEYCIAQAISNLVDNAIKYTSKGYVKLILFKDTSNNILLDIMDSGIGISKDYILNIYAPYTQEEIGYNRGYEGVGLGMSLVKKYLDINGFEISVKSEKNKGTTFTLHFKKSLETNSLVINQAIIPDSNEKHMSIEFPVHKRDFNILVVEDDAINQMYMVSILKKHFNTDTAFSAVAALKKIQSKKYDLILMDISLKGNMNGLELTRHLKNTDEYRDIPIIAITGHTSKGDRQNCQDAGCDEFLPKPFSDSGLIDKIKVFI